MIDRYSSEEMSSIWNEDNKVTKWLEVEKAVIKTLEEEEITPSGLSKQLNEVSISHKEVVEREAITNHDLAAFVDVLQSRNTRSTFTGNLIIYDTSEGHFAKIAPKV